MRRPGGRRKEAGASPARQRTVGKRVPTLEIGVVRTLLAGGGGALAGLGTGLIVSAWCPTASVYLVAVLAVGVTATTVLVGRRTTTPRSRWTATLLVASVLLVVAAPRPWATGPARHEGPSQLSDANGDVFAYTYLGTEHEGAATPVIFLHGGPGVSTRQQDVPWLEELARDRPVFAYDQIGTGGSSRLPDPTGYSLERARNDLETIHDHVGFDQVILVGASWGAVVAAAYATAHPARVEALIALAPGSLNLDADVADDPSIRLDGRDRLGLITRLVRPRQLYTYTLSIINPVAAHRLIGDDEMDRRYDAVLEAIWPAMFCDPALAADHPAPSGGFYANLLPEQRPSAELVPAVPDPPPTLVVKPECDYLPWSVVDGFVVRLEAQVAYIRGAGHAVHLEQQDDVTALVTAFLSGETPLEVLADPTTAPDTFQGPP
jgi:pimeloyl-ACP methyl ester carboxylesterase